MIILGIGKMGNVTSTHQAAVDGDLEKFLEVYKTDDLYQATDTGLIPLHAAVINGHLSICQEIMKNMTDINVKACDGCTPLHKAVIYDHLSICQEIVKNMTDINVKDNKGCTPLFYAAKSGNYDIVDLLTKADALNLKATDGKTPLHVAIENNHITISHLILDKIKNLEDKNPKDNDDHTPLHIAAKGGHFELYKRIMAESGDVNPTDKNGQTPEKFATWNEDLPFIEVIKNLKKESHFGWNRITNNPDSVVEGDLQKIMYLNDVHLLRKFIKNSYLWLCAKVNARGSNPLMTAAEFRSKEVLLILLNHLTQTALQDKSQRAVISKIIHTPGKSLLSLVMSSEHFSKQIISELVECEGHVHEWNKTVFKKCIFKFIGTNQKALHCNSIFKDRKEEEKGLSKTNKSIMFLTIFTTYLMKMKSVFFDVGTDSALLTQYANDTSVLYPKDLDSIWTAFQLSGEICFWWTLGPILLSFICNLIAATSFLKEKVPNLPRWVKSIITLLSPFWLLVVCFFGAFEETDKKLSLNLKKKMMKKTVKEKTKKQDDDAKEKTEDQGEEKIEVLDEEKTEEQNEEKIEAQDEEKTEEQDDYAKELINEGKMIEVCTESSLQPILQLYLFFLTILSSKDLYNNCISLWTIVQVFSFVSSVLSIPRSLTETYKMNKTGMMSTEAQVAYFLFLLCGVLGRILAFQLLAFVSGQLWIVFSTIGIHVCLMLILNIVFDKCKPQNMKIGDKKDCWQHVSILKDRFILAMANLYIPWSNGKNEEHDIKRQITVEIVIFLESLGISLWAIIDDSSAIQQHENQCLAAIWGFYGVYLAIKAYFFLTLHPWSDLIKHGFKTSILCQRKKTEKG